MSMPIRAARLFLLVTDVYVERLRNITEEEALQEGVIFVPVTNGWQAGYVSDFESSRFFETAVEAFAYAWDKAGTSYDPAVAGFSANPWVFVTRYKVLHRGDKELQENGIV